MKIYKDIFANIVTLAINIISPLILIPVLTGTLGLEGYGNYMAMIALVALCVVLSDLGFGMYFAKEVSVQRDNAKKISVFFTSFMIVKLLLSFVFLFVLYLLIPDINYINKYTVLFLLWLLYVSMSIKPVPFYNGLEKYTLLSKLELSGKLVLISSVLLLDFNEYGLEKAIAAQVISALIANFLLFYFLFKNSKIQYINVNAKTVITIIKSAFGFYSARLFLNIYNQSSTYLVSLVLKSELVAVYSIGVQLYKVGQALIGAISQVLYTRTVQSKNLSLILRVTIVVILIQLIFFPIVYFWGEYLISFIITTDTQAIADVATLFYLSLIFVTISSFWGYPVMVAIEKERYAHYGIFWGSIVYFIVFLTSNLTLEFSLLLAVLCVLIADGASCILRIYFSCKFITKKMLFNR